MKKFGFTLMEIIVTIGIIGVVAAITAPTINNIMPDKNKIKVMQNDQDEIKNFYLYESKMLGDINLDLPKSLNDLSFIQKIETIIKYYLYQKVEGLSRPSSSLTEIYLLNMFFQILKH